MDDPLVRAHINLDAIKKNVAALSALTPKNTDFMAVVKADGYGHGAVPVAKAALKSGATWLGVARIDEAAQLRKADINAPILVFGYIHPEKISMAADLDLTITLWDLEQAEVLSKNLAKSGKKVTAHLKVDTGMGRIGLFADPPDQVLSQTIAIKKLHNIDLTGLYTHFASADEPDPAYTLNQIETFDNLIATFKKNSIEFKCCHAANSAGIMKFPQAHYDLVRAGISIYGCHPSNRAENTPITLHPAMTITSIISSVKKVPREFCVSYGMTYKTPEATSIAAVPIGYADGFSRKFSSNGAMLVNGKRAPIIGRVCMDQTMIDIGDIPDTKPGDEVVIMGTQGDLTLSAETLGQQIQTINYEIIASLTSRVAKFYTESG